MNSVTDPVILSTINAISPLDESAMKKAATYQDLLAMPPGSMGELLKIAQRLSGITGRLRNTLPKKRIIVLCADNGVAEEGVSVVGVGEMGIGNTSTSTAVLSVLTGVPAFEITGRGGCITDEMLAHKKEVIEKGIVLNKPNKDDVFDVLQKVGGLDLAAMCGVFLGCAERKLPVVIDGYISIVAALCAEKLCPLVKEYFFPSHLSEEAGYKLAMNELSLVPYLNLGMRLGEGSGCPLAFEIMDASCVIMNDMATFEQAKINDGYLDEVRKVN